MNNSNVTANNTLQRNNSEVLCFPESPDTDLTKAIKTFIYCVIILGSLVGNSLVILVVYKRKRMRTTTNFMIVNMAVSDLLFAIFTTPPSIRTVYVGEDLLVGGITAELICKLVTFIQQVSIDVSILSLTAIAFDRFFAIMLPFRKVITCRTTKLLIALTWLIGILFNAPMLYTNRIVVIEGSDGTFCWEIWEPLFNSDTARKNYTFIHFSFFYAGPLAIITILYTAIVIELWRGNSVTFRSKADCQEVEKSNRKVLKMCVTVLVVFALFWLPVYIFQFMYYVGKNACAVSALIQFIGYFLCQATSAVNPLIYAFFSENYRSGFDDCLRAMLHCQGKKLFQRDSSMGNDVGCRKEEKVKLYIL
ncbi:neuropeptide FF receptor 2-like isoform X1 [Oculina patagonica]